MSYYVPWLSNSSGGSGADAGRTFYIDYVGGSDANNGTSTSTAWKRHPYMAGWTGSYTHQTGDNFIFKGGVTWPEAAMPMDILGSGTSGNVDYYGADTSWFSGASFTKPIFDAEYLHSETIYLAANNYITIDNLELKRVSDSVPTSYGLILGNGIGNHHITIKNCYLHGWRTTASSDDAHGGILFTNFDTQVDTIVIDSCEISNAENVAVQWSGVMCRMVGTIRNSYLHGNSSAVLYCLDFDGNTIEDVNLSANGFDGVYHYNGVYLDAVSLGKNVGYIRNSVFNGAGGGANMAYLNGRDSTLYCYNNVFYGGATAQGMIEVEPFAYGDTTDSGTYNIYNNTCHIESGDSVRSLVRGVDRGGAPAANIVNVKNNHIIYSGTVCTATSGGGWNTLNSSNNLVQTLATANGEGYNVGNLFRANGSTVNAGIDPTSIFSTDRLGASRPQGGTWDIGAYEVA